MANCDQRKRRCTEGSIYLAHTIIIIIIIIISIKKYISTLSATFRTMVWKQQQKKASFDWFPNETTVPGSNHVLFSFFLLLE